MKNIGYFIYALLALVFYTLEPSIGIFMAAFLPIMILRAGKKSGYIIIGTLAMLLLLAGYYIDWAKPLTFAFIVFMPVLSVKFFHRQSPSKIEGITDLSYLPTALSGLPLLVLMSVIYFLYPDHVAAFKHNTAEALKAYYQMLLENDNMRSVKDQLTFIAENTEFAVDLLVSYAPGTLYVCTAFITYFTEKFTYRLSSTNVIRLPDYLLFLTIAAQLVAMFNPAGYRVAAVNALLCLGILYFARGFDVLQFNMVKRKVSAVFRFFIYIALVVYYYVVMAVMLLGLVSMFKNLTKVKEDDNT